MKIREMEEGEGDFGNERESNGHNISVGISEMKYNGNKSIVEQKTLI
jgi:hypothetical protein